MYRGARRRHRARSTSNARAETHEPACGLLLGRFTVSQGMTTTPRVGPIPTNRLHGAGGWRGSQDAVAVMLASPMMATTIVCCAAHDSAAHDAGTIIGCVLLGVAVDVRGERGPRTEGGRGVGWRHGDDGGARRGVRIATLEMFCPGTGTNEMLDT